MGGVPGVFTVCLRSCGLVECGGSRATSFLLLSGVAIELAELGITVLLGPVGQVFDEILHLGPGGFLQRLGAAEIDRVAFHEFDESVRRRPASPHSDSQGLRRFGFSGILETSERNACG